jgi:hypothetical protein
MACPAAPAAAHPPDDGLVEAEIAAFDGFWQGRTLAAMHPQAGEIGASRAGQRFMRIENLPSMRLPVVAAVPRSAAGRRQPDTAGWRPRLSGMRLYGRGGRPSRRF